jgi:hypothetical protein
MSPTQPHTTQQVIDEAVFQAGYEKASSEQICSAVDDVDFIHVLRHSAGFARLAEYLKNERSTEGIYFWKAVERYEALMARFEIPCPAAPPAKDKEELEDEDVFAYAAREMSARLKVAHEIAVTINLHYVYNDSYYQVGSYIVFCLCLCCHIMIMLL